MSPSAPARDIPLPVRTLLAVLLALVALVPLGTTGQAADPSPAAGQGADVRMTARPMLGGTVRPGAWMAIRVHVENDGPAVRGEIHASGGQQGDSRYGVIVELPTGARQDHVLYAQPAWFGASLTVRMVSDGRVLAEQGLRTAAVDAYTPSIVVVAERSEGIVPDIREGTTHPNVNPPRISTIPAEDLPARVEAWSAIDRLVWQDVDTGLLTDDQLTSLRTWLGAGGQLVVVGGTTGTTTLGGLPADLLPFVPARTVDVATADLATLLGPLPPDATTLPAVAGILDAGTVLGRSGDAVFAAQRSTGQGVVTLIGIDPAAPWFAGTTAASALWRRFLPLSAGGAVINPLLLQDDWPLSTALGYLPSVDVPDLAVLFLLLLVYIALIGPINYLVLRRLDRREWAWVTMPVLVVGFAVAAWALGVSIKGTDTIVNQVGIVRTATGTDRGLGQVHVGIFSPTRTTYDVGVSGAALLTNPGHLQSSGQQTVPLDVVVGETSRLRGFEIGYAVLRTFRAESTVAVPRLDAALEYRAGVLDGTVTNASDQAVEDVLITWGGAAQRLGRMEPGAMVPVSMRVTVAVNQGRTIADHLFGPWPQDGVMSRTERTRRTVLDQVASLPGVGQGGPQQGPLILAWSSTPALSVDPGMAAKHVGDTLLLYPATVGIRGPTTWTDPLMSRSVLSTDANEASSSGQQLWMTRGTMTVEFRPAGWGGPFRATGLSLMITQGELPALAGRGPEVRPLPESEQPDQDDPVGDVVRDWDGFVGDDLGEDAGDGGAVDLPAPVDPVAGGAWDGLPDLQLFDRVAGRWMELPHPTVRREFRVADPGRYVDDTGAFLVRFVNRGGRDMSASFAPIVRLDGEAA